VIVIILVSKTLTNIIKKGDTSWLTKLDAKSAMLSSYQNTKEENTAINASTKNNKIFKQQKNKKEYGCVKKSEGINKYNSKNSVQRR